MAERAGRRRIALLDILRHRFQCHRLYFADGGAKISASGNCRTFNESGIGFRRHRRVVIPAAGFYEWNQAKEKATFTAEGTEQGKSRILYLAGFYGHFDGEDRFIILTTEANESMKDVHHRMPLILEQDEVGAWLCEDDQLNQFLKKRPGELKKYIANEQQRFSFL